MNINRHNYEEYFILYLDNELGSEDRRRVEEFASLHPDLKEELDLLLHTKLSPDQHIVFESKEELMMAGDLSHAINLSNYEEWLVRYMDNELNGEEKAAIEKFISDNPAVKKEWELIQRTKLQPETITFPNKELLYRKEDKVRRIPAWWRMAAAAAIVVAVGTTALVVINNNNPGKEGTPITGIENNNVKKNDGVAKTSTPSNNNQQGSQQQLQQNANSTAKLILRDEKKSSQPVLTSPTVQEEQKAIVDVAKNNNLPQPDQNPNVNPNAIASASSNEAESPRKNGISDELTTPVTTIDKSTVTNPATYASLNRPSVSPDDEGAEDDDLGKKNKLRGFFRKVTRTFEKRTNIDPTDGDDRLLVGGLSIKLK